MDDVESCTRAPVRPRRECQKRNRSDVDDNSRQHNAETSTLERNAVRVPDHQTIDLAMAVTRVNLRKIPRA